MPVGPRGRQAWHILCAPGEDKIGLSISLVREAFARKHLFPTQIAELTAALHKMLEKVCEMCGRDAVSFESKSKKRGQL